jgi:uncharacterized small protein (DUF1192 family)
LIKLPFHVKEATMAFESEDEHLPRRIVRHDIGQDLSTLSIDELSERIELLNAEIARLETARGAKSSSRKAADSFFKL